MSTEAKPLDGDGVSQEEPAPSRPTESPAGMILHPEPVRAVRISKLVGGAIVLVVLGLMGLVAYGGFNRQQKGIAASQGTLYKKVEPARADELQHELSASVNVARNDARRDTAMATPASPVSLPTTNVLPTERVVIRNAPLPKAPPTTVSGSLPPREVTPEERAVAVAYALEQQARVAPTGIRAQSNLPLGIPQARINTPPSTVEGGVNPLEVLARGLNASAASASGSNSVAADRSEYDSQNAQAQKELFADRTRTGNPTEDYLQYTRTAPLSRFEVKAGWEIPAALEQSLNSDLPGDLKALVMSNVYDTATGQYLLIPQGARLIGSYSSRIGYGQDGVQVAWHRVIFPDGSAINLNGMAGSDPQGNAGLRDKVDHHYQRLVGFAVLTSALNAALAMTQNRQQSATSYPSPSQEAASAAGREASQLGTQITRRNLNVQPTIKIPVGYKFNVRVNRDILFEAPYTPLRATLSESGATINGSRIGQGRSR